MYGTPYCVYGYPVLVHRTVYTRIAESFYTHIHSEMHIHGRPILNLETNIQKNRSKFCKVIFIHGPDGFGCIVSTLKSELIPYAVLIIQMLLKLQNKALVSFI